jgi:hypothetical protein
MAPTMELAPGRFSTTNGWPKRCSSFVAISRANRL